MAEITQEYEDLATFGAGKPPSGKGLNPGTAIQGRKVVALASGDTCNIDARGLVAIDLYAETGCTLTGSVVTSMAASALRTGKYAITPVTTDSHQTLTPIGIFYRFVATGGAAEIHTR